MSRQELADAVNYYLFTVHKLRVSLDDTYIGKLERGEHRWPNDRYRDAFRAVLGTTSDYELGFYIVRGQRVETDQPRLDVAAAGLAGDSHHLASHWLSMLQLIAAWSNDRGANAVMQMASTQARLIDTHRRLLAQREPELLSAQARWFEFASWAADNSGSHVDAAHWARQALSQAEEADNAPLSSYVVMRQAQQAAEIGMAADAVDLAVKARREFGTMAARTQALSYVREAHAHALLRDGFASSRAVNKAMRLLDQTSADEPDPLDSHCTHLYVAGYEGYCQLILGSPHDAVSRLEEVLADWPEGMRQDEVMWRAWLARGYADCGQLPEAGREGLRALDLAGTTGSARAFRSLGTLAKLIRGSRQPVEAMQFVAAFDAMTT